LLNEQNYMMVWSVMILLIAVFTLLFISEKSDRIVIAEEEQVTSIWENLEIVKDFFTSKHMIMLYIFLAGQSCFT